MCCMKAWAILAAGATLIGLAFLHPAPAPVATVAPVPALAAAGVPLASIDLNTADAAELARLPGLGETLAARIVAYRSQNGAFASVDELADVSGMTQRRIDAIVQYVIIR